LKTRSKLVASGFQFVAGGNVSANTTKFDVTSDGIVYMILSGRPGGGGRSSGGWKEQITSPAQMAAAGWKSVGKVDLINHPQSTIYERLCKKGESFTYSWEKYIAPALIIPAGASTTAAPSQFVEVRLTGFIDGIEDLRLLSNRANWSHRDQSWPTRMTLNGMDWNPQKNKAILNTGKTRFMPDSVDFLNATLTIHKGRDAIYFHKFKDHVYVNFVDNAAGGDVYDVTVRLPVLSPGSEPIAARPPAGADQEGKRTEVRFTGTIDGLDELRVFKNRANWNHREGGWPKKVTLNGVVWNPQKDKEIRNSGKTRFMPDNVNFQDATLTIHEGRGAFHFRIAPDGVYVALVDRQGGARVYDVTLSFSTSDRQAATPLDTSAVPLVAEKLESKRAPAGLNAQAVTFDAPPGNGRSGANGFLIAAPAGWETQGTLWSCDFSRSGPSRGVIFIHPHGTGHVVATVTPNGLHLASPGQWPTRGRNQAYLPSYPGIALKKSADFSDVFKLTDQSQQLTSKLSADGSYEFLLDGRVVATAKVASALPLQFNANTKFTKQPVTEVAKGTGGAIIGPTDSGSARALQLRFGTAASIAVAPATAPDTSGISLICEKLESKRAPTALNAQAVAFNAPPGDGRRGANGFLIAAPAGWETKGTVWSCEFARDGHSRGILFIHPYQAGHVVVTVGPTGFHIGSPGEWPKSRTYGPGYKGFPLQKSADFAEVFKLEDQSHRLTSKLAANGSYEFLLDGKVVATTQVTSVLPMKFNASTKFTKQSVTEVAKGTGGVIIGPTDKGSARASQLRFGTIRAAKTTGSANAGKEPFKGHTGRVNAVSVSPDGKRISSVGEDRMVRVWDTSTGAELLTLDAKGRVTAVTFSPDGKQIASGSGGVEIWDAVTGESIRVLGRHPGTVYGVAFSPDGSQIVSAGTKNTLKIWDAVTAEELRSFKGHEIGLTCVAFSPDGKQLVSGGFGKPVKVWDTATGQEVRTLNGHTNRIDAVCFSPNGKWIVSGSHDRTMKIWDAATGQETRTISGHAGVAHGVAFSPNSRWIISPSPDKTVKLWDVATGKELQSTAFHSSQFVSVAFSPDGKWFVGGADDGTLKVWNVSKITSAAATASSGASALSTAAANRKAAKWALGLGGTIGTDAGDFKTVDELPQQPFRIRHIGLSKKQVTNDGLANLRGLMSLTDLRLDNTPIGDAGLAHLEGLTNLVTLLVENTQITDAGLVHIKGMTK